MLTTDELIEVKQYVLRELPRVLKEDPEFVVYIEGILSERFPRRDEFARLLDEFTGFRDETRENFQRVDTRFDRVERELGNVRAELGDVRGEMGELRGEMGELREELRDEMGELRDGLRGEMGELRDGLRGEMGELRDGLRGEMGELRGEMSDLRDWVELLAGRLQNRVGRNLEDIVAGALRLRLERSDIRPEDVKLRQKISDPTGIVFSPGKEKEVDLVAQDGEILVFEVKSSPDTDDVDAFADKVQLVRLQNPDKQVTGILVAAGAWDDVKAKCRELGVRLIPE